MSESDVRIPGAEFRGFTDREEAMAFLQMSTTANVSKDEEKEAAGIVEVPENMVIAYVDGSFEKASEDMHLAV